MSGWVSSFSNGHTADAALAHAVALYWERRPVVLAARRAEGSR